MMLLTKELLKSLYLVLIYGTLIVLSTTKVHAGPSVSKNFTTKVLPYNITRANTTLQALFIFGDSTTDVGNNAHLAFALANANHIPYGRDFDTHRPTGRFSNGRLGIDFIAEGMGLPFPPPFLGLTNSTNYTNFKGVNFGSGAAGILDHSGFDLGERITFSEQIQAFFTIKTQLNAKLGSAKAKKLVSNSLFYLSIGNNDFLHNYILNYTAHALNKTIALQSIEDFSKTLVAEFVNKIEILVSAGARRFIIIGMGPLGCTPEALNRWQIAQGGCITPINDLVRHFNSDLLKATLELNRNFTTAHFTFANVFNVIERIILSPEHYGFQIGNSACCGVGPYNGAFICIYNAEVCGDVSNYFWWDQYHPTHKGNGVITSLLWTGGNDTISPMNIKHLLELPL